MNNVSMIGRLTKEPDLKYTQSNKAVCGFTLAVNRRFSKDKVDFINIVAWEKTAEFCGKYFQKGRQVGIVGSVQTRTYDNAEGKKIYITEIVAEQAYFADSKKESLGDAAEPQVKNETNNITMSVSAITDDDELPF